METEADFNQLKQQMVQVAPINTFSNFMVQLPDDVDPSRYRAVIIWCEAFGEFITSGTYQPPAE